MVHVNEPQAQTCLLDTYRNNHEIRRDEKVQLVDKLEHQYFDANRKYDIKSELINEATGEIFHTQTTENITLNSDIQADVYPVLMTIDTRDKKKLPNKSVLYANEYIYDHDTGELVSMHEGKDDPEQKVTLNGESIQTELLSSSDRGHWLPRTSSVDLTDSVSFDDFDKNKTYTLESALVYRNPKSSDEEPAEIVVEGTEQARQITKVELESGKAEVHFNSINTLELAAGTQLVAYERVVDDKGIVIADHRNLSDKKQTAVVDGMETTCLNSENGTHVIPKVTNLTLVDKMEYKTLVEGKEYKAVSKLMIKDAKGKEIVFAGPFESKFVAGSGGSGTHEAVLSNIDTSKLSDNERLVVYEEIYEADTGGLAACHLDFDSQEQSV